MTFVLVRREPSEKMVAAMLKSREVDCDHMADVWTAGLATSPEPTEQELDDLCRAMWGDQDWFARDDATASRLRADAVARMSHFLTALSRQQEPTR